MTANRASGATPEELHERAVAALVRVWGVSDREAREAIERAKCREARLRRNGGVIRLVDEPRVIDLTVAELDRHPQLWRIYDDHGIRVYGRIEGVLPSWSLWHTQGVVA